MRPANTERKGSCADHGFCSLDPRNVHDLLRHRDRAARGVCLGAAAPALRGRLRQAAARCARSLALHSALDLARFCQCGRPLGPAFHGEMDHMALRWALHHVPFAGKFEEREILVQFLRREVLNKRPEVRFIRIFAPRLERAKQRIGWEVWEMGTVSRYVIL